MTGRDHSTVECVGADRLLEIMIKHITVAILSLVLAACAIDELDVGVDDDEELGLELDAALAIPAVDEADPAVAAACPNRGCNCGLTVQGSAPSWYWKNCTGGKRKVRVDVIHGGDFTTKCVANGTRIYLSSCHPLGPIVTGCVRKIQVRGC